MSKYREILWLASLSLNQQSIADGCNVSKKTMNWILKHANVKSLTEMGHYTGKTPVHLACLARTCSISSIPIFLQFYLNPC